MHDAVGVRAVAAIPAIGLLAGSAFGFLTSDIPLTAAQTLLIALAVAALLGWCAGRTRVLVAAVGLAFFVGGALLATDAWHRAWRPSLRIVFEELARKERAEVTAEGRTPPEDDSVFAVVTGTLTADATPSAPGVSLSLDIDTLSQNPANLANSANPLYGLRHGGRRFR